MTDAPARRVGSAVIEALAKLTGRPHSEITDDTTLDALGLDSLDLVAVLLEVEELLGAYLPIEVLAEANEVTPLTLVGDLVRVLSAADADA